MWHIMDIVYAIDMSGISNMLNLASQTSALLLYFWILYYTTILIISCYVAGAIPCAHLHLVSAYRRTAVKGTVEYISISTPWKHIWGFEVELHSFLTLALDGGMLLTSHPVCFIPQKEFHYPWNRSMCGFQNWFGRFGEEKTPMHLLGFEPRTPSPHSSRYTKCATPAPLVCLYDQAFVSGLGIYAFFVFVLYSHLNFIWKDT
jgi:hypothetical protein